VSLLAVSLDGASSTSTQHCGYQLTDELYTQCSDNAAIFLLHDDHAHAPGTASERAAPAPVTRCDMDMDAAEQHAEAASQRGDGYIQLTR